MRYKVRAALSSVRGSTSTAGSTNPSSFLGGSLQAVLHMLTKELKYLSKLSSVFLSSRASALNWDQSKAFLSGSYTTPNDDTVR